MAMKENSKKVLNYLKEINGQNVTAADVVAPFEILEVLEYHALGGECR